MHDFVLIVAPEFSEISAVNERLARSDHRCPVKQGRCGDRHFLMAANPRHFPDLSGSVETGPIRICMGYDISLGSRQGQVEGLVIEIAINSSAGTIVVDAPVTCPHQLFYRWYEHSIVISTQIRTLVEGSAEVDPRAVYSLLQFGAVFPPWSIFRGIYRFTPGKTTTLRCADMSLSEVAAYVDCEPAVPRNDADLDAQVLTLLDAEMQRLCPDGSCAIMFSGGVDSGLVAARAAALGWRDVILVHLSFDENDIETTVASRMAEELGLPIEIVMYDPEQIGPLLETVGTTFPQPFGDHSVVPTAQLIKYILAEFPDRRSIFSGDGADSDFGLFRKIADWRRVYHLPLVARQIGGLGYRVGELAARPGRIEWALRLLRRSAQFKSPMAAILGQNPLHGIAYEFESDVVRDVLIAIDRWVDETVPVHTSDAFVWLSQMYLVAGMMVQKYSPFVVETGQTLAYPYMQSSFLNFVLDPQAERLRSEHPKAVLKRLLSKQVSRDLVYRPKLGFVAPAGSVFSSPSVARILRDPGLCNEGPLAPFLLRSGVSKLIRSAAAGHRLPNQTENFLWALVFGILWLE